MTASQTLALKSPEPVAHNLASEHSFALQTAPLCPANVPIQSPVVASLSMGWPSKQALTRK